jgi:hypothetical protein
MSDQNGSDAWSKGPTFLQAAFQRAEVSKKPLEKSNVIPFPTLTRNIRRHKLQPALTPTGHLRRGPDRQAFMEVEAQDRKEAIQNRKAMNRSRDFLRASKNKTKGKSKDQGPEL